MATVADGSFRTASRVSLPAIVYMVARHYGILRDRIRGRHPRRSLPRQVAIYLAREYTSAPLTAIGEYFDGRHHTAILDALEAVERQRSADDIFARELLAMAIALDIATGRIRRAS